MRDQGRLVEWFDDKGYGFIQPNDSQKGRVFLHIRDFARKGPRPIVGCALEYLVILDEQGRHRAIQVVYLKAQQARPNQPKNNVNKPNQPSTLAPMQIACVLYILAIAVLSWMHVLPSYSFIFIALMNALSYWLYAQDKEAAQLGNRRMPEQSLHIVAFLGGWPAAWLAQQKLRHKTQKQPFRKIYFCTIVLNILLLLWFISPLNVILH
ncbi:uncharacterized membrane protein YsdA (DUF1294 family)/cold shock CspA family protein [Acinetobacter baylyi]|uniref:Uncharacterized membrane protein YsdA (DUF1294 family)/cold shock CspA family protein n=1 Tax=Acinetobacter baylyi TaxID=202950 RepID=A0ABU0UX06_ACIBI|nr:DUF1294 domain-containing protein [Acinetobacter baylyi]MDQ1208946.1 uncharacterized membrane protein YsdA (DUF1294 family)/cold shock CspA family protein [Acinetobacter baylyi]MDR6107460.1 uncharacterized membrane protein YsdA (DUF1294 family)/cold shock CspA family protein [Acinetobacter baylyi]MDR6185820.1 uncharacterized membrane protein YsdA (DUF1294 family)/cold shock CspA family protein [Acinetobacter baylyi]